MHNREQIAKDIRFVNSTAEGERLLGYLMDFCHVFKTSMPVDCNPNMTLYNEGQRSVGNEIVALLVNEPERFKAETIRKVNQQQQGD